MRQARSSILKMISDINEDHHITEFPGSYCKEATPYSTVDFTRPVKQACSVKNGGLMSGLKISKCIVIGDVHVGKTCIVNRIGPNICLHSLYDMTLVQWRFLAGDLEPVHTYNYKFCYQVYQSNYKTTIGVDFEVERFRVLDIPFTLQIWDTAGQERFRSIAAAYYRGAHAMVIVYDMTNLTSLSHSEDWKKEAIKSNPDSPYIFLVGTKKDLLSPTTACEVENHAKCIATQIGAELWSVSSRTGEGVVPLFRRIAALVFERSVTLDLERKEQVNVGDCIVTLQSASHHQERHPQQKCGRRCIPN